MLRFNLCGEGLEIDKYVPQGQVKEVNYAGNFQNPNPYSKTYNLKW